MILLRMSAILTPIEQITVPGDRRNKTSLFLTGSMLGAFSDVTETDQR